MYDQLVDVEADVPLFLDLAGRAGGPVLELACGTGRCLIPFIRQGFDVVGIDSSEFMLARLQEKLTREPDEVRHRATPIQADGDSFSLPLRFGLAFIAANGFTHLLSKDEQELLSTRVFEHLRPGGLFVIDVFNPGLDRLLNPKSKRWEADGLEIIQEETEVDLAEQMVALVTSYLRKGKVVARIEWALRYTFRYEMVHLLEKVGFQILHLWGDYDRHDFGEATDRLFVVAQKPEDADMPVVRLMHAAVGQAV